MMTECAICYSLQECLDDGEALICEDRAACQERYLQPDVPWSPAYQRHIAYAYPPLDDSAIGRKIDRLMHEDRQTLIDILGGVRRQYWPKLAHAYLAALGIDSQESRNPIVPGVIYVWSQIMKEAHNA